MTRTPYSALVENIIFEYLPAEVGYARRAAASRALRSQQPDVVGERLGGRREPGVAHPLVAARVHQREARLMLLGDLLRADVEAVPERLELRSRLPSTKLIRPITRCLDRKARALAWVSFGGSTATASAGTSWPSRSSAPRTVWAWSGQVSSQWV